VKSLTEWSLPLGEVFWLRRYVLITSHIVTT